jgi:uncharacterized 2Fe-2S/4Fe-4S cluster protein (DUF4445 family)
VDIGTTTIAAYLVEYVPVDGSVARVVRSASALNRQRAFGADVIARIDYAMKGERELGELAALVRADVRSLVDQLLSRFGADAGALREISVVGNTTMLHLFAEIDPAGIATAPFTPAFVDARHGPAADFGLPYPHARLFLAPSVAGYVGADVVAAARAVDLDGRDRPALVLDLGTNGEMALGDRTGVFACATAAGPAFEGAAISCGLGGVAGAVDGLYWRDDGRLVATTIGGLPPIGVCGSGIVDAAACLVRAGIADDTGALDDRWREVGYPLTGGNGSSLRFTQADVRQIQLAKAAVAGGIATLLRSGAWTTTMWKPFPSRRLRQLPEARVGGGHRPHPPAAPFEGDGGGQRGRPRRSPAPLFKDELERIEHLARSIRYVELSSDPFFSERFVEEMFFPEPGAVLPAVVPAIPADEDHEGLPTGGGAVP